MRCINVGSSTAVNLAEQTAPFLQNYTVVVHNPTSGSINLQGSDASNMSNPVTLAAVPALSSVEVTLTKQYILGSAAGPLNVYGN